MDKILRKFMAPAMGIVFMVLALLLVLMPMASQANAYDIKKVWARFSATAGESLSTGEVVALKDADGKAYKADADNSAFRPAVGIIGKGGASGDKVEIITHGIFTGWSSLAEGSAGYLSTTAGAVTQSEPSSYKQQVGVAISATEYLFDFQTLDAPNSYFTLALHHEGQETSTLDPAATFQMPFAATLVEVSVCARAIDTSSGDETYTVDLEEAGASVLSNAISISASNTPVVGTISDTSIADNAKMEVVLTLGGTTPAIDDLTVLLTYKASHTN